MVKSLAQAGTLVAGKTNMDEFGMGSHSLHSYNGPVENDNLPGPARSAGGSSGGSAMAVANGQCRVALGTDTGGSIRLPAAFTGLVGFKPSYGQISRFGVVAYANSLDTVGIIGKSAEVVLQTFRAVRGPDDKDPTSMSTYTRLRFAEHNGQRYTDPGASRTDIKHRQPWTELETKTLLPADIEDDGEGTNWQRIIGVPKEYVIEELSDAVRQTWARSLSQLEAQGHRVVPISLPHTKAALSAYYVLALAEASSNLAKYDGVRYGVLRDGKEDMSEREETLFSQIRGAGFGAEVKRRILLGTYSLCSASRDNYFLKAQKVRRLVQGDFDSVFRLGNALHDRPPASDGGVDYILCPTAPSPAPPLKHVQQSSPIDAYVNDVFTVPASLAGLPTISVPAPVGPESSRLGHQGIGMQLIGQYGDDEGVLDFAQRYMEPSRAEMQHYGRRNKKRFL